MQTSINLTPKKKFGQNFLVNQKAKARVLETMFKIAEDFKDWPIVEVGPGQGDLTEGLVCFNRPILALEVDPEAVQVLQTKFANLSNLEIRQQDALQVFAGRSNCNPSLEQGLSPNFLFFANLPFNVGSRILVDLPLHFPHVPLAVILQKEVAEKTNLSKDFTFFGAWLSLFWQLDIAQTLPPHLFFPQPKVNSALLVGRPKILDSWLNQVEKRFQARDLLKTLFRYPRKTVWSNLHCAGLGRSALESLFTSQKWDLNLRLVPANYHQILPILLTQLFKSDGSNQMKQ
jgi:16S rRNA (adenine1518-N6/adenine1519-N6)-dimethyltransferase